MIENSRPKTILRRAFSKARRPASAATRRAGFTMIEILVALAIFSIMMVIIFVPLNLGLKFFHIGKTRSDMLASAQTTMDAMERELRKAIFVFPNEALPGVTDRAPYNTAGGVNPEGRPYLRVNANLIGVCDTDTANATYVDNASRLDFLLADNFDTASGTELLQPISPLRPTPYFVSFYARRQKMEIILPNTQPPPPEPFENPIVLFRAQMPYREHNGAYVPNPVTPSARNANLSSTLNSRYPNPAPTSPGQCDATSSNDTNLGSYWLNQFAGTNEPNLEPLCFDSTGAGGFASVPGTHTQMLPRGVSLLARKAYDPLSDGTANPNPDYTPDTTFHCADTDGDHKIDQVKITLSLSSFDDIGADRKGGELRPQNQALTQTISLPNVR